MYISLRKNCFMSASKSKTRGDRPARIALRLVDGVYPAIKTGLSHWQTRSKQRIAWQLGFLAGYAEARRAILSRLMETNDGEDTSD